VTSTGQLPLVGVRLASRCAVLVGVVLAAAACGRTSEASPATTASSGTDSTRAPGASAVPMRFSRPWNLAHGVGLATVSCASPTSCVALDLDGRSYEFDGSSWTGPESIPGLAASQSPGDVSVSCASATMCVADPDGGDQVATWNGESWSAPTTLSNADALDAVGCAPSGYCAAVDGVGTSFASVGGVWHETSGDWGSVSAISCVSSSFCMSVSGGISLWTGGEWTEPDTFGATSAFTGISCPSVSFCVAVDAAGQALQWNGSSWSAPVRIEPGQPSSTTVGPGLDAVSCPSNSFCVAVDDAGRVFEWSDGSWSRTDADGDRALTALSCPAVSLCVAVDQDGDVLIGRSR
jgi:hypothetical protein